MQAAQLRRISGWATLVAFASVLCIGIHVVADQTAPRRFAELSSNKKAIYSKGGTEINYGNSSEGYIMVKRKAGKKRLKLKITQGSDTYQYDLNNEGRYEVFPLQLGNGTYKIQLYEQIKGTSYSTLQKKSIDVKLSSKNVPFLYPNQYVMYDETSACVAKSYELCANLTTDKEKFETIYEYVSTKITYHYIRAMSVKAGYLPDIDDVLKEKMGICFDYAAVMACMLRVQGIPTQLAIGRADKVYHAWNLVYQDGEWVRYDPTFKSTNAKEPKKYTVERRY